VALNIDKKKAGLILWVAMEAFYDVLFEVSNEDRYRILLQLADEPMNVTQLSKRLGLSLTETSRHLSRIGEVGLTRRDSDGLYHINNFGTVLLAQLKGVEFVTKNRNYFISHSLTGIPEELLARIGELSQSIHVNDISATFYRIEKMIQEAEEFIWIVTDHYLINFFPFLLEAIERDVVIRNIEAKDWVAPQEIKQWWFSKDSIRQVFEKARTIGILEEKIMDRLDMYLFMSEREVAIMAFPLLNGKFDYLGFSSGDKRTNVWCRDLYKCYWNRAKSRSKMVEQLSTWIKKKPDAINALKDIAEGKEIIHEPELISELEKMSLLKDGKLTVLADFVYTDL